MTSLQPALGKEHYVDPASFRREIARARTFGFMRDVAKLWSAGYALGATFENTLVVTDHRILKLPMMPLQTLQTGAAAQLVRFPPPESQSPAASSADTNENASANESAPASASPRPTSP